MLGVASDASQAAVKSAYRKLALRYHPDRNASAAATERFLQVSAAYEVLSNPGRRADYDRLLDLQRQEAIRPAASRGPGFGSAGSQPAPPPKTRTDSKVAWEDIDQLRKLFERRHYKDAETLANRILDRDPRQVVAYGILGEIVRSRGEMHRAARYFAMALQMDPQNSTYLRKHEEALRLASFQPEAGEPRRRSAGALLAPFVGAVVVACTVSYVVLSRERPLAPDLALFSTWTMGLVVMMLLAGVAVGASLSYGGFLDRLSSNDRSMPERIAPAVALLFVAVASFWLAALMYLQSGLQHKAFDYSAGRLVASTGFTTCVFAASLGTVGRIDSLQAFLWGGNLVYLGAVIGWAVADVLMD